MAIVVATNALAGGKGKVKKEKTNKLGIMVKGGTNTFSMSDLDFDGGMMYGAYVTYGGPLKPKNPECRWNFETGFGLDFYNGKAKWEDRYAKEDDILMIGLTIPFTTKYILNPLSSRGKWNINAGIDVSFAVGVPELESSNSTAGSYNYRSLKSGSTGVKAGLNAGIGYDANHWGISIGGHAGFAAPLSSESSSTASMYGLYGALKYFF